MNKILALVLIIAVVNGFVNMPLKRKPHTMESLKSTL